MGGRKFIDRTQWAPFLNMILLRGSYVGVAEVRLIVSPAPRRLRISLMFEQEGLSSFPLIVYAYFPLLFDIQP
jgi:hypothetical protein